MKFTPKQLARMLSAAITEHRADLRVAKASDIMKAADKFLPRAREITEAAFARAKKSISRKSLELALNAGEPDRVMTIVDDALEQLDKGFRRKFEGVLDDVLSAAGNASFNKIVKLRAAGFNPDQPRDDEGQWSDGGGSGSDSDSTSKKEWSNKSHKTASQISGKTPDTPVKKFKAYHVTKRANADAILEEGFDLKKVKPRWVNDLAVSLNKGEKNATDYFSARDPKTGKSLGMDTDKYTLLEVTVKGRLADGDFNAGRVGGDAQTFNNTVISEGYDGQDLGSMVYVHNTKSIVSIKEVKPKSKTKSKNLSSFDESNSESDDTFYLQQNSLNQPSDPTTVLSDHLRVAAPKVKGFAFDRTNPRAKEWVSEHVGELIDDMMDSTRTRVRDLVEQAIEGEFDTHDLADRITELIGDESRAETIARTETMAASNGGQREAWAQAVDDELLTGNEQEEWIATPDDVTCPICQPMDGVKKPLGGQFNVGGELIDGPPAHPRCRCTTALAL